VTADVDAIVVTTGGSVVLDCVDHLRDQRLRRVILVDNGSLDARGEAVSRAHPETVPVRLEAAVGATVARNRGVEAGDAPLLLFVDDDALAAPGAVGLLAEALLETPAATGTAGRLVDPADSRTQDAYRPRKFPSVATLVALFAGLPGIWPKNPWTGGHLRRPLDDETRTAVEFAPSACLMVRRDAFEAVGGWDERYWFWWEDVDLTKRLAASGPLIYVPAAVFRHVGGSTSRAFSEAEVLVRFSHGLLCYIQAHFGWPRRLASGVLLASVGGFRRVRFARRKPELALAYRSVAHGAVRLLRGRPVPSLHALMAHARLGPPS
jgi:N-acetylglucosaminyl-diphospho-decaprenol L-rhamnosyltransferase